MRQSSHQFALEGIEPLYKAPPGQLLKWIGNKQRFAASIAQLFPSSYNRYIEPFLGSGAVLATVEPLGGIGSDVFQPLVEIWQTLRSEPETLISWYSERYHLIDKHSKEEAYYSVRDAYNASPNGADLLFLSRACYGGVVRFRKMDGFMSTPCGAHDPISPLSFRKRVDEWHSRVKYCEFLNIDYREAFALARAGDLIYCDPPYSFSQSILYGAQAFSLQDLFREIEVARSRDVKVALSIDGMKKSGDLFCNLDIPSGLFEREESIDVGRSMLRRFQMVGKTLEDEIVTDRLLLTY